MLSIQGGEEEAGGATWKHRQALWLRTFWELSRDGGNEQQGWKICYSGQVSKLNDQVSKYIEDSWGHFSH